jgi:hypothetical protein
MAFWIVYDEPRFPDGVRLGGYGTLEEAELQAAVDLEMGMPVVRVVEGEIDPDWNLDAERFPEKGPDVAKMKTARKVADLRKLAKDPAVRDVVDSVPRPFREGARR